MSHATDDIRGRMFHSVTSVRGLASLAVCWFHIGLWTSLLPDGIFRYSAGYGWLGPHVFFIVSGFVVPWSMYVAGYRWRHAPRYIVRRVVRLDPPYLATIALVLALGYVGAKIGLREREFEFEIWQFLSHVAYLTEIVGQHWYNPVFWTLAIEFQYYLAIAIFFPLIGSRRPVVRRGAMLLCMLVFLPLAGAEQTMWLSGYLPLFMLGFTLFQKNAGIIDSREMWFWMSALILLVATFTYVLSFLSLLAFLVMFEDRFRNSVTEFLGKVSYSLYLIHMPVGIPFVLVMEGYAKTEAQLVAIGLVATLLCVFAAWLFYLFVEQPSIRLAKRIHLQKEFAVSHAKNIERGFPVKAAAD